MKRRLDNKGKRQTVYFHLTPELKAYIGRTTRERSLYQATTYRNCTEFWDAVQAYGWDNISHHVVESGLDEEEARNLERQLIDAAGRQSYNVRMAAAKAFTADESSLNRKSMKKRAKKETSMKRRIKDVRVELMLDNRYRQSDGTYAITVRVYHQRKYLYIHSGWSLTPEDFSCMPENTEKELAALFGKVCGRVTELVSQGTFDLRTFKCPTETTSAGTLAELVEEKGGLAKTKGTENTYANAAKLLRKMYPDGLPLKSVGVGTIGDFGRWMEDDGYSDATRAITLSCIKASINFGIYRGWLKDSQYPFKRNAHEIDKVTMPKGSKRNANWLTAEEVGLIEAHFARTHDWASGCFLFSYLTGGMNVADMVGLKFDDFYFDEEGFCFVREKIKNRTGQVTVVPVCDRLRRIIRCMGAVERRGCSPIPRIGGRDKAGVSSLLNARLKKIAKDVGIEKSISINTARHTFATLAVKSGMPVAVLEHAMSHAATGVLSHYIGQWSVSEMRPYFERLP